MSPTNEVPTYEELLAALQKLRQQKKYGLVWEQERTKEQLISDDNKSFPMLTPMSELSVNNFPGRPQNIFIEGDNYPALLALNFTHREKVNVIYIDPPYNTGNNSWKYNNDYVERDDNFKHSKWLSFMDKRLRLAKNLLTDNGIIIVAIDDYEIHTLRLLMDEIFGEPNRLGTITVVHNPRGRNDEKFFATCHEYLLVYALDAQLAEVGNFRLSEDDIDAFSKTDDISAYSETPFIRTGNNSTRVSRPNLFYPVYFSESKQRLSLSPSEDSVELLPINEAGEEKTWRWGKETFDSQKDTELVVRKVKGTLRIFKKRRLSDSKGRRPKTVWSDSRYDASAHGIMVLQKMFKEKDVFPYPKSLYAVKDILELVTKPDSIVLDFFAGSGTTGHAVALLNRDDGGNRKFILCTNNEGGIADEVCYPRIVKVIEGVDGCSDITGIPSNLFYYKVSALDRPEARDDLLMSIAENCVGLIMVKESCHDLVTINESYFVARSQDKMVGVYFSPDPSSLDSLIQELSRFEGVKVLYCFTLDSFGLNIDSHEIDTGIRIEPMPTSILDLYESLTNA